MESKYEMSNGDLGHGSVLRKWEQTVGGTCIQCKSGTDCLNDSQVFGDLEVEWKGQDLPF